MYNMAWWSGWQGIILAVLEMVMYYSKVGVRCMIMSECSSQTRGCDPFENVLDFVMNLVY